MAVDLARAADYRQHRVRMPSENLGRLLHQPTLVFHRVNAANGQQQTSGANRGKGHAGRFPMVFTVEAGWHAVRLHHDPFARLFLLEQGRFLSVTSDDGIGVLEQPPRTQQCAEQFAPFESAIVSVAEIVFHWLRQIQKSTVDRHD